ncbi:MAG: RagB/SusD family nutrient uptake outer membrane protein [Saprospiraceae bacterium]|nr:RagB/SusD family nutrient uptake outer membrane protein [Saprospiraceae bacterium]
MQAYKKISILLIAAGALMVPNACQKDLLDPAPLNSLSSATAFSTPDRFISLLNGLYDNVKSGAFYGSRFTVYGDIRAEEFLNETTNNVTGFSVWNHTVSETNINDVNNLWNAAYYAINSCNIFIEGADANRAVINDDAKVNSYIAEARFLRALCYHSLLSLYCRPYADGNGSQMGVPLRLRAEVGPGNNDLARASVAEVYTQILTDLDFAEQNLLATHGATAALLNTTRAHKNTAIALKTRVYLNMQRYADVVTEANKIVSASAPFTATSGVAHALQADVKNVFATPYTTTESIFSMPFTTNDLPGTQNGLGSYYNPGPRGIGDYSINKAGIVGDSVNFTVTDARRQFVFFNSANSKWYLNKFATGPQHTDYGPVIRYAEVLLNLAEAEARANGLNQRAVDLLNAVHGRSEPSKVYALADFADANAFISQVLTERRIELLGEGFRNQDCQRLLAPLPGKGTIGAVDQSSSEYIWPIPSGERAVNKLCLPNP